LFSATYSDLQKAEHLLTSPESPADKQQQAVGLKGKTEDSRLQMGLYSRGQLD